MRVAILRFPGSNCDADTLKYFRDFNHRPFFVWYTDTRIPRADLIVLPGGFAFGDRVYKRATHSYTIDPGTQALRAPVMDALRTAAKKGVPIFGICNGFQILVKAKLLPGKLERNRSGAFFCDYVDCVLEGERYSIPVAHGYGNYRADKKSVPFISYINNPNGSQNNIAGVWNGKNIWGMMPHPERSPQRASLMRVIEKYAKQ